jgi:hypothetical protein
MPRSRFFRLDFRNFCGYDVHMAGRPRKPKGAARENVLRVRLTDKERGELDEAASVSGLDTSTWVRYELLSLAKKIRAKRPVQANPLDTDGDA